MYDPRRKMEQSINKYSRLPGKRKKVIGKDTLWEGPDHMLMIESSSMAEDYKRFYYKDIKSIVFERSQAYMIINCVNIGMILFSYFLYYNFYKPYNSGILIPAGFIFVVSLYYLISNLYHGRSCNCWIETAVQRENLQAVKRVKHAEELIEKIEPWIIKAQGSLPPEIPGQETSSINEKILEKESEEKKGDKIEEIQNPIKKKINKKILFLHKLLYLLAIATGLMSIYLLFNRNPYTLIIGTILVSAFGICSIISIARLSGVDRISKSMKKLSFLSLGLFIVGVIAGYVEYTIIVFKNVKRPEIINNQWNLMLEYSKINPLDNFFMGSLEIISIVLILFIGFAGFNLLRKLE